MSLAKHGPQCGRPKIRREMVLNDVLNIHKNFRLQKQQFFKV